MYGPPIQLRVVGKQEEVFDCIRLTELPKLEQSELCSVVADSRFGNTMLAEQLAKDCRS